MGLRLLSISRLEPLTFPERSQLRDCHQQQPAPVEGGTSLLKLG